jgi:hypothetical protein
MATLTLALTFVAAIAISAGVLMFFWAPLDYTLTRIANRESAFGWSLYAKFALFMIILKGGLDVGRLEAFAEQASVTSAQCIIEVYKAAAGSLWAAACGLLAFFAVTQLLSVGSRYLPSSKSAYVGRRDEREPALPAGRP